MQPRTSSITVQVVEEKIDPCTWHSWKSGLWTRRGELRFGFGRCQLHAQYYTLRKKGGKKATDEHTSACYNLHSLSSYAVASARPFFAMLRWKKKIIIELPLNSQSRPLIPDPMPLVRAIRLVPRGTIDNREGGGIGNARIQCIYELVTVTWLH